LPLIPKQTKCSSFQAANMRMSGFLYVKEIWLIWHMLLTAH
jgi:hypothetical protein